MNNPGASLTDGALAATGVGLVSLAGALPSLGEVQGVVVAVTGLVTAVAALARAFRGERNRAARCGAPARYYAEGRAGESIREAQGTCDRPKGHRGRHVAGEAE